MDAGLPLFSACVLLVLDPQDGPMVKRRYVEEYLARKLLEVYSTKAVRLAGHEER